MQDTIWAKVTAGNGMDREIVESGAELPKGEEEKFKLEETPEVEIEDPNWKEGEEATPEVEGAERLLGEEPTPSWVEENQMVLPFLSFFWSNLP